MSSNDTALLRLGDVAAALALLTRLPLPVSAPDRGADSAWAWPLAGLVVGGLAAAVGWLCQGLPSAVAAGLVLTASVMATGALHEDGLADVADGFWGGFDAPRRLEIMRDSRIGSYGVLALGLSLGLRWSALAILIEGSAWAAIVAAAVLSRAPMAVLMWRMPPARPDGLSRHVGRPSGAAAMMGAALAIGIALAMTGGTAFVACAVLAVTSLVAASTAHRKIGGQTGDVLGTVQQLCEIVALATFTAMQ